MTDAHRLPACLSLSPAPLLAVLVQLIEPHQHLAGLAPVRRAQDPCVVQLVDDPRRASVSDPESPLQQGSGAALVLNARFGGLAEQYVALAGLILARTSLP